MLRRIFITLFLLIGTIFSVFASHHLPPEAPVNQPASFDWGGRIALIMDIGDFDFLTELEGYMEDDGLYRAFSLGAYYRVHRNIKLGLFYTMQSGVRHDDDWIELSNEDWEWADPYNRVEHLLTADFSPRFLLPFLPGKNWVASTKLNYTYNFYNQHQKILLKPALSWFLMIDRAPVLNISVSYGVYFPVNFGETIVYEHGPYLGIIYHLNESIKLELTGEYAFTSWSTSADSLAAGDSYLLESERFKLGLGVILKPSF